MRTMLMFAPCLFLLAGCAAGRKMSYEHENVAVEYKPARTIAITFHDERDDVVSGKQKPTFVGQLSSTVGIPYNMQTESGNPLALEFANALKNAVQNKGLESAIITLPHTDSIVTALRTFVKMDQERLLLFKIHQWEAKAIPAFSNIHYEIISHLELNVYDTSGNILATSSAKDFTEKKKDMGVSVKHLQEMASEVLKKEIREMINDPAVRKALE